jgi:hypothetical protein
MTPSVVQYFLIDIDQGRKPAPFTFRLPPVANITRNRGPGKAQPPDERRKAHTARRRQNRVSLKQLRTTDRSQPFQPSRQYRRQLVSAMEDPDAPLGPAAAVASGDAPGNARPTIVGGNPPPRYRGNIGRMRIFGLKALAP